MPTHKQIRCTTYTEAGPLQEYPDPSPPAHPTAKTAYVQAQHASKFWIKCEALPEYNHELGNRVSFRIAVNGEDAQSCWVSKAIHTTLHAGIYSSDEAGENYLQFFEFATMLLVEDQDVDERVGIGEISIWVLRSEKVRGLRSAQASKPVVQSPSVGRVTEELLKVKDLTYVVKLGCKEPFTGGEVGETMEFIDTKAYPYVHFRIFYRSKRVLQDLGLIPRTHLASPSASPLGFVYEPEEAEGIPLEAAQKMARLRAQLESLEKRYKVKREIKDVLEDDEEEEKKHNPRSKWMRSLEWGRTREGEEKINLIDLTIDDSG